ncbi:MAG: hypothetical protein REI45_11940, partial [Propionicimonas sp.]|nr:hypothetical protein [Propionicimonas sp.]
MGFAGGLAAQGFHVRTETELELAGAEIEGAGAVGIEAAIGDDAVLELGAGEAAFGGDGFDVLDGFGLEALKFDFLGDAVELHQG